VRILLWMVRIALVLLCALDVWLMAGMARYGPGMRAESASGGGFGLLPVQWAAAGYVWLGALISFQLLLITAEVCFAERARPPRKRPHLRELVLPARLRSCGPSGGSMAVEQK
jgi:hypothetical protein